jgi:hypothetical protein
MNKLNHKRFKDPWVRKVLLDHPERTVATEPMVQSAESDQLVRVVCKVKLV